MKDEYHERAYGEDRPWRSEREVEEYNRVLDTIPGHMYGNMFSLKYDNPCDFMQVPEELCACYDRDYFRMKGDDKFAGTWASIMALPESEILPIEEV